ncbi:MAG: ATP-binding cassette domain-containing protein [Chitinivibrionales bacterium]|nr:ATP-binding cassette domain-containing protein [Chitinivibrionales bacterium]
MIQLTSLSKRYKSVVAVDNVSFTVDKGDLFALLGPNGAGKTSIVRMVMGFSHATSGSVRIDGTPCTGPLSRAPTGYLAENHRIPPFLTGLEYLRRHAELIDLTRNQAHRQIPQLLELVKMSGKEKQKARTYSKGMTQRIGLASALLGSPKLLILDEPTSGLDPIGIREFRLILEQKRNEGMTILLNSHLLSEVEKTCSTAAIMINGKIAVKDTISAIIGNNESLEDVFVKQVTAAVPNV